MAPQTHLHTDLLGLLRQHSRCRDQRHLVLLAWMVLGLLLSETVCFDRWKSVLPLGYCFAGSWQRRVQRWLSNCRIEIGPLYGGLILWALQHWQKPGERLLLALDTTMLWNRYCVVVVSVVVHGRAIPVLWQTLEHSSASISAEISIAMLEKVDQLLVDFGAITLLADRGFPCAELLRWFDGKTRWRYLMRLPADTIIHGTAAPLGCQVRRLRLPLGYCRGLENVQLWSKGQQNVNLLLANPAGIKIDEPWYLVTNAIPALDLVWNYANRFCCEQLFRDQKGGLFQLEWSGLRDQERIDRLLLVVAIAVLVGSLQGYAVSQEGLRHQVDPHWQRGMSFMKIGVRWFQEAVANAGKTLLDWIPIPQKKLEPCVPSRAVARRKKEIWFTRVELPPQPPQPLRWAVA